MQDITLVFSNVKGTGIYFHEGLLYFTGNYLTIAVINKKSDPTLNVDRVKRKQETLRFITIATICFTLASL